MGPKSPVESKKNLAKAEDSSKPDGSLQSGTEAKKTTPPRQNPATAAKQPPDQEVKKEANADTSQSLAPPPRPTQQNAAETSDYFSSTHNNNHFSLEPNPFEQSFGISSAETPGKSLLPPVAALTSPASLLGGGGAPSAGFNWPNSLRSGPLSPAMLTGPTGSSDYFDGHLRGGFPTPNESSLRTGLTPGGGGSMFPAPSPGSQAILQQLASGGATPSTLDFHRTAMNAAAARKSEQSAPGQNNAASIQAQEPLTTEADGGKMKAPQQQGAQASVDPFGQHDANDAANGLFLLAQAQAQARNGAQDQGQFSAANQQNLAAALPSSTASQPPNQPAGVQSQNTSPNLAKVAARNASGSIGGGSLSGSVGGISELSADISDSGASEKAKPSTRNKGKKSGGSKSGQNASGRRKAEETPSKPPASKKAKGNSGSAMPDFDMPSDDDIDMKEDQLNEHGKKMTDEEKRKNFLERNRVAALKCRQRKKQWLANLQAKVEIFSSENDALSAQVQQLREEIMNLKTLLLAHKDCPVSQAQGLSGMAMNGITGDYNHHANPYGMAMANGPQVMAAQGMQRTYG
ncbi:MAG: hypothetical protein M1833_005197 [Piccolia ochrophora]|nr:MAG: hypothetical protein M1833_005197 [Piccolia ochrophora]